MTTPPRNARTRWPRNMRTATAAEYCDMSPNTFRKLCPVRPTKLSWGVLAYDRLAIDAWLDRIHDTETQVETSASDDAGDGWDDIVASH